jgi:hypothetical protein
VTQEPALPTGYVVGDRYEVVAPLGAGELGSTYEVCDIAASGASLVLKLFAPGIAEDIGSWESFSRTARAASTLPTDVIVKHLNFGVDAKLKRGYAVSERVHWLALSARVSASGPLTVHEVAAMLQAIGPALETRTRGRRHSPQHQAEQRICIRRRYAFGQAERFRNVFVAASRSATRLGRHGGLDRARRRRADYGVQRRNGRLRARTHLLLCACRSAQVPRHRTRSP